MSTKNNDYTSSSEFEQEDRVQITNEVPLTRSYEMMHHSLQNDTWKWLIGTEDVEWDVPYDEATKTVNGTQAKIYGEQPQKVWNSNKKEYELSSPTGRQINITGVLSSEHDLFIHEIYRYFHCIYPDHPDWLNLLTRNEIIDIIDNAAAQVDYKPNNEFFRIVADSFDVSNVDEEELKLNIRNLADNAERRKYYGSIMGYRMFVHDILENVLVLPVERVYPFNAVSSTDIDYDSITVNKSDERYDTSFRKIDWIGRSSDISFLDSKELNVSGYIIPDKPNIILEYVSGESGKYTLSDYSLYNSDEKFSFYKLISKDGETQGTVSDTYTSSIVEEIDYSNYISSTSPDDKIYGFTSANRNAYYNTAYRLISLENLVSIMEKYDMESELATYQAPYKNKVLTNDASSNWLYDLLYVIFKKIDSSEIMTSFSYIYNPFVKDTIILQLDEMLKMYDNDISFNSLGNVINKDYTKVSLNSLIINEGDLITFTDYNKEGSTPYKVMGGSYGYIDATITPTANDQEYMDVVSYSPFNTKNNDIISDDNYGVVITTSSNDKIVLYGKLKFSWTDNGSYVYANAAKFYIRAIPDKKSDKMFEFLYDEDGSYEEAVLSINNQIESLQKDLLKLRLVMTSQLYSKSMIDEDSAVQILDQYEAGALENKDLIVDLPSYDSYKNAIDKINSLKDDLQTYEKEKESLCENRSLILDDNFVSNIILGNKVEFFQLHSDGSINELSYIKDSGTVSFVSFGNISLCPVYPGEATSPLDFTIFGDKTISFCQANRNTKIYDVETYQLYSDIREEDIDTIFKPTVQLSMYNETTFDVSTQVYVDKDSFEPVYEIQFLSDDAKKKFDSLSVGSSVSGLGIPANTYVKSKSNYTAVLNNSLPSSGYINLTFSCPVTSSADSILNDPFFYKKLLYSKDLYKNRNIFDTGLYGSKAWPSVSDAVICEDEFYDVEILNSSSFTDVVKYLYKDKISAENPFLVPSLIKNSNDVFVEINAKRLFHKENHFGDTLNLCNVEWLDYIQHNLEELKLAKENINVGFNVTLNADTSGYASFVNESYTDENLRLNFQTVNWSDSIPAYAQIGTGGSNMIELFKLRSDVNYPNLYGVSFYDKAVSDSTDDEGNIVSNWVESSDSQVSKRITYSTIDDSSSSSSSSTYSNYQSIDEPLFEIPINEYNIVKDYNKFTLIDLSFYEQSFNNITFKTDLNVIHQNSLSSSFIDNYRSVSSVKDFTLQDDGNLNYYYLTDKEFLFYNSIKQDFAQYDIICGGCIGKIPYYKNGEMFYVATSSYYTQVYDSSLENVYNFKRSLSLKGDVLDENRSYNNLLKRLLVIKAIALYNDDVSSVNVQYNLTFNDVDNEEYISTNDLIKENKELFRNNLIIYTYYSGNFNKNNEDIFNLKDFDLIGLIWNQNIDSIADDETYDVDFITLNKNYTFCSNDLAVKPDNLTLAEYNLFFGYNKYSLYKSDNDNVNFNLLDTSSSILQYSNNIIQSIELPRKFINDGLYDIKIILDPKFLADGYLYQDYVNYLNGTSSTLELKRYNISQSPLFYDSNYNIFYTNAKIYDTDTKTFADDDSKIVVKFNENKYFKNLKILYGQYTVKSSQQDQSIDVQDTPYIEGILNENFDISDLNIQDKFVYVEEVKLRNIYMSSLESLMFKSNMTLSGEIVGIKTDGSLIIRGKRNNTSLDVDFISFLDKIYPAEKTDDNSIIKKDLGSSVVFDDVLLEKPSVTDYNVLTSKMSSYDAEPILDFKYFKNLLVLEGEVNLSSPSIIEPPEDNSLFNSALNYINAGDQIIDAIALNSTGASTHTVVTNIKEKCKYLCYNADKLLAITSSGKIYEADSSRLGSTSTIQFTENKKYTSNSSDEILEMMYDSTMKSWVATYGLSSEEQGVNFYGNKYWTDTVIKDLNDSAVYDREFSTTNPASFNKKSDDSDIMVYYDKFITVNDSLNSDKITATAQLKPEDVAIYEYDEIGATESDKSKYGDLYIDKDSYAYVIDIKEGPYQVEDTASHMYERLFTDGDISIVIMQDYLFVNTKCYKVDDTGAYTNQLTTSKHWKAAKVPLLLDNTKIKLKSMTVEGTNSAYDYVKSSFTEFCSWALDTATKNSDGTYSFSGLELTNKFTQNELEDYKAALIYVRDNLLTYSEFVDKIEYYSGSIQITDDITLSNYPVSKVRVDTGLPLMNNFYVNSKSSYVIESTNSDVIIRSKAYGNIVDKEALYYEYLYTALVYIRGDKEYDSFGAAAIAEMFTSNNKLYFRTFNGDILYINKTSLYKASDIEDSTNWNVSLMPASSYMYAWQDRDKIGSYETVLSNIGSEIPVNSKEIRAYFFNTVSDVFICPDERHIFIGGYSYSLDTIADKYNTLKGDEEAFDKSQDWVKNLTSSWLNGREGASGTYPFVMYSNDAGETFNILPVVDYIDDAIFNSDDNFSVDHFTYDETTGSLLGFVKKGNAYESNQIVISFDTASGDVVTSATQYKQMSIASIGDIHTIECDDAKITYASGELGYGVDGLSSSTFNFDYTGGTGVTVPEKMQVISVDESIKLNKGLITNASSGKVRILLSIYTNDDISDPFEFISSDESILSDYIKSNSDFKISLVQEVNSYKNADRVYSPAYFVDNDNVYPTVKDDDNAKYYEYVNVSLDDSNQREDNYEVKYLENDFNNNIKLCNESGDSLILDGDVLYSYYDIITSGLSELDFDIAGKPKFTTDELSDLSDAMTENYSFKNFKSNYWSSYEMNIDSFNTDSELLTVSYGNSNIFDFLNTFGVPEEKDVDESDKTSESKEEDYTEDENNILSLIEEFIVENEGDWGSTDNPYSSFDDRFKYVNGYLFDNKYDVYALNLRYFVSMNINIPYLFYNNGDGMTSIPKAEFLYKKEDEEYCYLNDNLGNVNKVYLNTLGYGGLRNISESDKLISPWERDPDAFKDKILLNSYGDYVYLSDENGNNIKVYNAITELKTNFIEIKYDSFNNIGLNTMSIDNKNYYFYRLQNTSIKEYHSTESIYPGMKIALRFYKNLSKITDVEVGDAGQGAGIIVNSKNEPIMKASIEKDSNGTVFMVTDWLDDTHSYSHTSTSDSLYCKFIVTYSTAINHIVRSSEITSQFKLITTGSVPFIEEIDDDKIYFFKELNNNYVYLFNPDNADSDTITKTYVFKYENYSYDFSKELTSTNDKRMISTYEAGAAATLFSLKQNSFSTTEENVLINISIEKDNFIVTLSIPKNIFNDFYITYNNINIFKVPMVKVDYDITRVFKTEYFDKNNNIVDPDSKKFDSADWVLSDVYVGNERFDGSIENLVLSSNKNNTLYYKDIYINNTNYESASFNTDTDTDTDTTVYYDVVSLDTDDVINDLFIGSIVSGLYDYSLVKAPKYSSFYELLENEGEFIKTGNTLSSSQLTSLTISNVNSNNIELLTKIDNNTYNDYQPHYFLFKMLTSASQYVAPENMNNDSYYKELTLKEFEQFSADRVWYNTKGAIQAPITVGNTIINSEYNSSFYDSDYTNYAGTKIYICDENGYYIAYNSNKESFRLDSNLDGDCSSYVYPGVDERIVSKEPINRLCVDWFKSNMYVEGNEINPFWQVIYIKPILKNKKWQSTVGLYKFTKKNNSQVLEASPDYPIVNIENIKYIDTSEDFIQYDSENNFFNAKDGKILLLLTEGVNSYVTFLNNADGMTLYAINMFPDNIGNMFSINDSSLTISSNLICSYTVNSKRDNITLSNDNAIVKITEMGIFDKSHNLIAYSQFPPIEYRSDTQHISFTCAIYNGNMTEIKL